MRIVIVLVIVTAIVYFSFALTKRIKRERLTMLLKERMGFTDQQLKDKSTDELQAMVNSMGK